MDDKAEPFRSALDKAMQLYLKDHYPSGVVTVSASMYAYSTHVLLGASVYTGF